MFELLILAAAAKPIHTNIDVLLMLSAHAGVIAGAIRGIIAVVRSGTLGDPWGKLPKPARVLLLVVLMFVAAVLDAVAGGQPWPIAIFVAVGGLGAAISTAEIQERLIPPRK
jgi:hypothetical protein